MSNDQSPKPIEVESLKAVLTWQSFRVILLGGCAIGADHFMRSETAIMAVMAAAGFVAAYGYGVFKTVRGHFDKRAMARLLPDDIAVVPGDRK